MLNNPGHYIFGVTEKIICVWGGGGGQLDGTEGKPKLDHMAALFLIALFQPSTVLYNG